MGTNRGQGQRSYGFVTDSMTIPKVSTLMSKTKKVVRKPNSIFMNFLKLIYIIVFTRKKYSVSMSSTKPCTIDNYCNIYSNEGSFK